MKRSFYLVIAILLIAVSCSKDSLSPKYDPNEMVVKINVTDDFFSPDYFLVLENDETNSVYLELQKGETYIVQRGDSIKGKKINLHFIYINSWIDDAAKITSYIDLELGKEISISPYSGPQPKKHQSSRCNDKAIDNKKSLVDISFSDVPEFDIATRSARHPGHSHTLSSLEVPCASIGGNTYPVGGSFYVCLNQGDNASYKLVTIPSVSEYEISLNDLNSNMTKYSIPKNPNYEKTVSVNAHGSAGDISIFSLAYNDESLFAGNTIDVYTPIGIPEMVTFSTNYRVFEEDRTFRYTLYSNSEQVVTEYSFLDIDISLNHAPGSFPVISTTNDNYDCLTFTIGHPDYWMFQWVFYAPNPSVLYAPKFPDFIAEELPDFFSDLFENELEFGCSVFKDTRINNYQIAINSILEISPILGSEAFTIFRVSKSMFSNFN